MRDNKKIFRIDPEILHYVAEHIAEVFWVCEADSGKLIYVSPSYEQVWGRSREALYGDAGQWLEAVHPEDKGRMGLLFEQHRCKGKFSEEYRIVRPDGEVRWVHDHVFVVLDGAGLPHRVVGIAEDITARKQIEEDLRHSREQLRELVLRQQWDREVLRTRIAREIHDELGQSLMALNMNAYWLLHQMPEDAAHLREKIEGMIEIIVGTVRAVQRISSEMRPSMLDELGLGDAMRWYIEQFQERSGIRCQALIETGGQEIDADHATAVYRVLQEALTNILRHSDADKVAVQLRVADERLLMEIRDNGRGIDHNDVDMSRSFGLLGMEERAGALGGTLEIQSEPGEGTRLVLSMPLQRR